MNNGQMDRGNEYPSNPAFSFMIEERHEKTPVRLVGTGILTRDLPNASLVRYHGATSLGVVNVVCVFLIFFCTRTGKLMSTMFFQYAYLKKQTFRTSKYPEFSCHCTATLIIQYHL